MVNMVGSNAMETCNQPHWEQKVNYILCFANMKMCVGVWVCAVRRSHTYIVQSPSMHNCIHVDVDVFIVYMEKSCENFQFEKYYLLFAQSIFDYSTKSSTVYSSTRTTGV